MELEKFLEHQIVKDNFRADVIFSGYLLHLHLRLWMLIEFNEGLAPSNPIEFVLFLKWVKFSIGLVLQGKSFMAKDPITLPSRLDSMASSQFI